MYWKVWKQMFEAMLKLVCWSYVQNLGCFVFPLIFLGMCPNHEKINETCPLGWYPEVWLRKYWPTFHGPPWCFFLPMGFGHIGRQSLKQGGNSNMSYDVFSVVYVCSTLLLRHPNKKQLKPTRLHDLLWGLFLWFCWFLFLFLFFCSIVFVCIFVPYHPMFALFSKTRSQSFFLGGTMCIYIYIHIQYINV